MATLPIAVPAVNPVPAPRRERTLVVRSYRPTRRAVLFCFACKTESIGRKVHRRTVARSAARR